MGKKYTQCKLTRNNESLVTWIPSQHAVVGRKLWVDVGENREYGWEVGEVFSEGDKPEPHWQLSREHKKKTGDSIPKEQA